MLFLSLLIKTTRLIYLTISIVKISFQIIICFWCCWSAIIIEVNSFFSNWSMFRVVSLFKNLRWQLILSHSVSVDITTINWLLKTGLIIPGSVWSHLKFFTIIVPLLGSCIFKIFIFMSQDIWLKLSSFSRFTIFFTSLG